MPEHVSELTALSAADYDRQWRGLSDFIRLHPGARHRRRLIRKMLRNVPFASVVDVGCGAGELIPLLAEASSGNPVAGCDLSPGVIEGNRRRFPNAEFHVLDIVESQLAAEFNLVVCSEVIEHLQNQERAFANLARMVAPGGHLLITCPTGRMYRTEVYFGHVKHPTAAQLWEMAVANGLSLRRLWNWGWPTYRLLKFATNVRPDWAIRNFASGDYSALSKAVSHVLYWTNFLNISSPWGVSLLALFHKPG